MATKGSIESVTVDGRTFDVEKAFDVPDQLSAMQEGIARTINAHTEWASVSVDADRSTDFLQMLDDMRLDMPEQTFTIKMVTRAFKAKKKRLRKKIYKKYGPWTCTLAFIED